MGRRGRGLLFEDFGPGDIRPEPQDASELAEDERAILEGREPAYETTHTQTEGQANPESPPTTGTPAIPKESAPGHKPAKKRRSKLPDDAPLVDRVRERAGRKIFSRIKLYEQVVENESVKMEIRMRAAEKLDAHAIGKDAAAPPIQTSRERVLIGHAQPVASNIAAGHSGLRAGGDMVQPVIVPRSALAREGAAP